MRCSPPLPRDWRSTQSDNGTCCKFIRVGVAPSVVRDIMTKRYQGGTFFADFRSEKAVTGAAIATGATDPRIPSGTEGFDPRQQSGYMAASLSVSLGRSERRRESRRRRRRQTGCLESDHSRTCIAVFARPPQTCSHKVFCLLACENHTIHRYLALCQHPRYPIGNRPRWVNKSHSAQGKIPLHTRCQQILEMHIGLWEREADDNDLGRCRQPIDGSRPDLAQPLGNCLVPRWNDFGK